MVGLRELRRRFAIGRPFAKLHGDYVIARAVFESSEFFRSIIPLSPRYLPHAWEGGGELLLALHGLLSILECKNACRTDTETRKMGL